MNTGALVDDEQERESVMKWLFAAYAVIWLAVFIYLFDLGRKQRAIAREIAGIKAKLGSADKK